MIVQRYTPYGWCSVEGELHKDDQGAWVSYEDYKELLKLYVKALLAIKERDEIVALVGDISQFGFK